MDISTRQASRPLKREQSPTTNKNISDDKYVEKLKGSSIAN
jgi:hypothetical protein